MSSCLADHYFKLTNPPPDSCCDKTGASLVPEQHDDVVLTYVPDGQNGEGEIATATYFFEGVEVAKLGMTYNSDNCLINVERI